MIVIGEALPGLTTEFKMKAWPSGETTYCCRYVSVAVLPTLVRNIRAGVPGSSVLPSDATRMRTDMSQSSAAT